MMLFTYIPAWCGIERKENYKLGIKNMKRSETTEQIQLFSWAERNQEFFPELALMFHVPNEGIRTNGGLLKMAGMKSGVPDIVLAVPKNGWHGLYLEMKYGTNKTSKNQDWWLEHLTAQGYATAVCYGFVEAREEIRQYLKDRDKPPMQYCEEAPKVFNKCFGCKDQAAANKYCGKCQNHYTKGELNNG